MDATCDNFGCGWPPQFAAGLTLLPWLIATALREYQSFGVGFLKKPTWLDLPLTLWNFAIGLSSYFLWPVAVLALAVCVAALLNGLRRGEREFRPAQTFLALWGFLPLVCVWLLSQRHSFYADRYLAFVLPGLALLLAFGTTRIRATPRRGLLMAGLIVASGYGLLNTRCDPAFIRDDWRGAAAHVAQNEQPGDVVLLYTTHIEFSFGYYFRGASPQKPISLNLEQYPVDPLTAGHRRAWVVYPYTRRPTHYPMQPLLPTGYWNDDPDRNPNLVQWFDAHAGDIVDYRHSPGIELWLVNNPGETQ